MFSPHAIATDRSWSVRRLLIDAAAVLTVVAAVTALPAMRTAAAFGQSADLSRQADELTVYAAAVKSAEPGTPVLARLPRGLNPSATART